MIYHDLDSLRIPSAVIFSQYLSQQIMLQNVADEPEEDIYYYHPDHLGSASYISDASGLATQHIEYFPFGEVFVEENVGTFKSMYKFNAKELDDESGLYYYGARYYDPRTSVFLGVDPKADDFPSWSPYTYTLDNPIKYIDKKGKNPLAIIGAVVGASKEILSQTISNGKKNLDAGNGFFHGWAKQMDWADVGISTVAGAIAGLTGGGSLLLTEAPESLLKSAVDWKGGDPTPNVVGGNGEYKKDLGDAGADLAGEATGTLFGKASGLDKLIKSNKGNFKNSSILSGITGFFNGLFGTARDEIRGEKTPTIGTGPLKVEKITLDE